MGLMLPRRSRDAVAIMPFCYGRQHCSSTKTRLSRDSDQLSRIVYEHPLVLPQLRHL